MKPRAGHFYEQEALGYNYRLTDIQCALGISQLRKLERFVKRRREIAAQYDDAFTIPAAGLSVAVTLSRLSSERRLTRRLVELVLRECGAWVLQQDGGGLV